MFDLMTVRASTGTYRVEIIEDTAARLASLAEAGVQVVCDANVARLHPHVVEVVPAAQFIQIEAVEASKTMARVQLLLETLADRQVRRNQQIVAIGGGIVQDLTAFAASVLYRGVEWVFFPTTLLAQADSCIGSKTSINLGPHKNLVGSFHPPAEVWLDTAFLETLSVDDIRSGLGEIMHYYLYAGSPLADSIVVDYERLLTDRAALRPHIEASLSIKCDVIEADEFDRGERNKFNYGHTFGHALETATQYAVNHGQAVTVGMDIANRISLDHGLLDSDEYEHLHKMLSINLPAYDFSHISIDDYLDALSADKKNVDTGLTCILSEGPGKLVKRSLPMDAKLRKTIEGYFRALA